MILYKGHKLVGLSKHDLTKPEFCIHLSYTHKAKLDLNTSDLVT